MAYDMIIIGLGAMGSATLYQAAKRGAKVLALIGLIHQARSASKDGGKI